MLYSANNLEESLVWKGFGNVDIHLFEFFNIWSLLMLSLDEFKFKGSR